MDFAKDLEPEERTLLESGAIVLLPDINHSTDGLCVEDGNLRLGFDCVRGLDDERIHDILQEREVRLFADFCDFLARVRYIHRSGEGLLNLIRSGAFDSFGVARSRLLGWNSGASAVKTISRLDEYWNRSVQAPLDFDEAELSDGRSKYPVFSSISKRISSLSDRDSARALSEMESAALLCRPVQLQVIPYRNILLSLRSNNPDCAAHMRVGRISSIGKAVEFDEKRRRKLFVVYAWFEGIDESFRIQFTTRKKDFDSSGIREGSLVRIRRQSLDWNGGPVRVCEVRLMPPAREMVRRIIIKLNSKELTKENARKLKSTLDPYPGINPVCIHAKDGDRMLEIELPLMIDLTDQVLLSFLRGIFDYAEVISVYDENMR